MRRAVALLSLVAFAVAAPSASGAEFGFVPGSLEFEMLNAEGAPETRAGSHPDRLQIGFVLNVEGTGTTPRDFVVELPPGFGGSASAVPGCPRAVFEEGEEACPEQSQVGIATFGFAGLGDIELPLFQLEPAPGEMVSFSALPGLGAPLRMEMRPADYGITFKSTDLPKVEVTKGHVELWGVPADHQEGTSIPRRPLLTAPTRCGPMTVTVRTRSWQDGAPWLSESASTSAPLTGCESLAFEPGLAMQLSNPSADSPTGARMELILPEDADPDGLAASQLRDATIQMPAGVTVSPGGAAGTATCSDAEFGLGTSGEVRCPSSSRVGTVELVTPNSHEPLAGTLFAGQEHADERFRLLLVASAPGLVTKFSGALQVDPATGRLATTMRDLPQVPIERLTLNLNGGEHALLASPLDCGTFAANGRFVPWGGGAAVDATASVSIASGAGGSPCPPTTPFSPKLVVSSSGHAAGRATAISMTLQRQPGEQLPRRFAVTLPKGLSAATRGIDRCPDADAAAASCPAASQIGSALAEVGSGASPAVLHGEVYLGGPHRRAPFSLVTVFRARIGSFDLGAMSMRSALRIEPRSGRVTVESDPLPALVEGVPVRFRTVKMGLDRAGVIRNPTSCAPAAFDATIEASSGATATTKSELRVTGCDRLGFKPRFALALTGRSQLRKHGRPGLSISARFRRSDAALRALRFSLPDALRFRLGGLGEICSRRDARDELCGARARVGSAYASTPLLDEPLRGSVYVVQPPGDGQPDLWVGVGGGGTRMSLRGTVSVREGRFLVNLTELPDMPLSEFSMRLRGGRRGMLALDVAPCAGDSARSRLSSSLLAKAQNGAARRMRVRAKASCGASG